MKKAYFPHAVPVPYLKMGKNRVGMGKIMGKNAKNPFSHSGEEWVKSGEEPETLFTAVVV